MNDFQKEMIRLFGRDVIKYECERRNIHQLSPTLTPAIIYSEISGTELAETLPSKYVLDGKEYWTHRYVRDTKYKLTSLDEIKRFLKWNI